MNDFSLKALIHPALAGFPEAVADLDQAQAGSTSLRLIADAENFHHLRKMKKLEKLWCFRIDSKRLEIIASCAMLNHLYIDTLITADMLPLASLQELNSLSIEACSKAESLQDLEEMQWLSALAVLHFKRVCSLEPLKALSRLKALAVAGSIWTRMKVETLEPLSNLNGLKYLDLTSLRALDNSLEPLSALLELEELDCSNSYPMEQFAKLSAKLPKTKCSWFSPYVALPNIACKKCGQNQLVILTGKGKPTVCLRCNEVRVRKHEEAFRNIVAMTS